MSATSANSAVTQNLAVEFGTHVDEPLVQWALPSQTRFVQSCRRPYEP